jgi:hypothetical protein
MPIEEVAAQAVAAVDRARSLYGSPAPLPAAGQPLQSAAQSAAGLGQRTGGLSGELVDAHHGFVDQQSAALSRAGGTDTTLDSHLGAAAAITASGARQLDAIAARTRTIAQAAVTARSASQQRMVLAALRSTVQQANDVMTGTQQKARDITDQVQALTYHTGTR